MTGPNELDPLLRAQSNSHKQLQGSARRLYISHFLSTWNSRAFEFGAVLYLATVFPGTLLPMSLYALARGLSGIVLAPAVGWYIDTGDRLRVVRASIGMLFFMFITGIVVDGYSPAATGRGGVVRHLLCTRMGDPIGQWWTSRHAGCRVFARVH